MLQTQELEVFPLWAEYADVNLYLEWEGRGTEKQILRRILIFAYHPQIFLQPWGRRWAAAQDLHVNAAHKLAGLASDDRFHRSLHWSIANRFPRLQNYPEMKPLAQAAMKAIINSSATNSKPRLEKLLLAVEHTNPGSWRTNNSTRRLLSDVDQNAFLLKGKNSQEPSAGGAAKCPNVFSDNHLVTPNELLQAPTKATKIADIISSDKCKPAFIPVKCKSCAFKSVDQDPKWHKRTGKYIAKAKICPAIRCSKRQTTIPQHPSIKYVTYSSVMVGISRVGNPTSGLVAFRRLYLLTKMASKVLI
jgi:hypothetical protein